MKKNKNWLKEQLSYLQDGVGESFNDYSEGLNAAYNTLEILIDQLEEPELPVVPQFVAEIIEKYKENDDSLGELLASVEHANIKYYHNMEKYRVDFDNLYEPSVGLCATIARAWIDGYSVEREKLYYVALPYIGYMTNNKDQPFVDYKEDAAKSTEQEIKAIDERFWTFAEEVEK